jgi:hypothetical protein
MQNWIASMTDEEKRVTFGNAEYTAIEAAVMETERGRWFLREYAKRNRNADTEVVLAALGRIEKAVQDGETAPVMDLIRATLQDMAATLTRTKGEIGLSSRAGDELGAFADAVSQAAGSASEDEFQAIAEQRIRLVLQTLRHLEGHIQGMIAICDQDRRACDGERSFSESSRLGNEQALHPSPHPSFLM